MILEALISELGQQMGVPELRLQENRTCSLRFDARILVVIESPDPQGPAFLHGVVGSYPADVGREFLLQVLEANLLGRRTEPGYLAVRQSANEILLVANFNPDRLAYSEFAALLEAFVNRLECLQGEFAQLGAPAPDLQAAIPLGQGDVRV